MLLGGLRYLLPVIAEAHKMGIYVITVDYLPNNIAHQYSDEYHNLSILDKEAVLALARNLGIDGIMSFAVDPGVTTAAYVAEQLGLPFQGSYESVSILQDKSKFRNFLKQNGFNTPNAKGYSNKEDALRDIEFFNWPVIVKPVDSAGSKGVSKVCHVGDLQLAIENAIENSHSGRFILEDYLEQDGFSSDSDCFTIDGNLSVTTFSDQRFDSNAENPYTPSAYSWPSTMPTFAQDELKSELQRLLNLLDMRTGIYNVETRLCKNGKVYIMEVSPRGGGNRLAEMVQLSYGIPLIKYAIQAALGEKIKCESNTYQNLNVGEVILHSEKTGKFSALELHSERVNGKVIYEDLWVQKGDIVNGFKGANNALGVIATSFPSIEDMQIALSNIETWCKVVTV